MNDSEQDVEKTLKKEGKGRDGMMKSVSVVSALTMLSRVSGLIRDVIVASIFGTSMGADAFFVAFKIPNFMRRLFAEGAFAQAFVPVLTEYKTTRTHDEVQELVNYVAGALSLILGLLTIVAVLAAPIVIIVFAPGFTSEPDKLHLAGEMLRLTFPYLMLISLTAFAGSILNSYGRFAVPAFAPVILNICLIGCALWLSPLMIEPANALAWGVLMAGVLQLLLHLPFLARIRLLPIPSFSLSHLRQHEGVRRIITLMVPAMFGVSVSQINLLLDTVLASFLVTGSVSWLYFSDRLVELPLGVIGIALATVILPSLSEKHTNQSPQAFAKTLDWAMRVVLLIGVPAAVALFVLAEPILAVLFQRGAFGAHDVAMAAQSLRAYTLGLLAFMLIKVLAPGYYARQDIKTPVKIGIKAMVANMILNLLLIGPLAHAGLALATSIAAFLNAGWLLMGLRRQGVFFFQPGWPLFLLRLLIATSAMVGVLFWLWEDMQQWLAWGLFDRVWHMTLMIFVGTSAYVGVLYVLGVRRRHIMGR